MFINQYKNQQPRAKASRLGSNSLREERYIVIIQGRALARQVVSLKANLQYAASGGEVNPLRLN